MFPYSFNYQSEKESFVFVQLLGTQDVVQGELIYRRNLVILFLGKSSVVCVICVLHVISIAFSLIADLIASPDNTGRYALTYTVV